MKTSQTASSVPEPHSFEERFNTISNALLHTSSGKEASSVIENKEDDILEKEWNRSKRDVDQMFNDDTYFEKEENRHLLTSTTESHFPSDIGTKKEETISFQAPVREEEISSSINERAEERHFLTSKENAKENESIKPQTNEENLQAKVEELEETIHLDSFKKKQPKASFQRPQQEEIIELNETSKENIHKIKKQ